MNILKAYISGFKTTLRSLRMITVVYILNLFLGLIVAITYMSGLKSVSGNSLEFGKLLTEFDYTLFSEILRFDGDTIRTIIFQGFWIAFLYMILSIFLSGGILSFIRQPKTRFTLSSFFSGSGKFFYRFFKLSVYTLIVHLIFAIFVYLPFSLIFKGLQGHAYTEKILFFLFVIFAGIHILLAIYLIIITDYTRFILVSENTKKVFRSLWRSTKFVTGKFFATYGLYLMLLIIPIALFYFYFLTSGIVNISSGVMILAMFLIQQLFIWLRVCMRIWTFASQFDYYIAYTEPAATISELKGDKMKEVRS